MPLSSKRKRHLARVLMAVMLAAPPIMVGCADAQSAPQPAPAPAPARPAQPDQPDPPVRPALPVPDDSPRFGEIRVLHQPAWSGNEIRILQRSEEGGPAIEVVRVDSGMLPLETATLHVDAASKTLRIDVTRTISDGPVTSDARFHTKRVALPHDLPPGEWTLQIRERTHMRGGANAGQFGEFTADKPGSLMLVAAEKPVAPPDTVTGKIESLAFDRRPGISAVEMELVQPADGKPAAIRLSKQDDAMRGFSASLEVDVPGRKLRVLVTVVNTNERANERKLHEAVLPLPANMPAGLWIITVGERTEFHDEDVVGVGPFNDGSPGGLEVRRSADTTAGGFIEAKSVLPEDWSLGVSTTDDGAAVFSLTTAQWGTPNVSVSSRAEVDRTLRTIRVWITVMSPEADIELAKQHIDAHRRRRPDQRPLDNRGPSPQRREESRSRDRRVLDLADDRRRGV